MSRIYDHFLFICKYAIIGLAIAFAYILIRPYLLQDNLQYNNNNYNHNSMMTMSYASAVNKITPAVVSIYAQSKTFNSQPGAGISPAAPFVTRNYLGSGVIISTNGHIVTNKHVIKDANKVFVSLFNNQIFEASFVGADKYTDLAVIKINVENLIPAQFADSELLNTGDVVLAIGNPFGLNQSASLGIISATGRKGLNVSRYENFIQTDAAINEGNSGGPLINPLGEVVGISTASYNQYGAEGINFAIPSNTTTQIIDSIIEYGEVLRGWLGISFVRPQAYLMYGLKKPDYGILVSQTRPGTTAYKNGIKGRDIITHINNKAVNSFAEYNQQIVTFTVGDEVTLKGVSEGKSFSKVMLVELPRSK
ncbi:MAG: trypsin-like peptidase domain-containing protein [Proteobacteria bacterium]|nr:trypsin-like peptidase domain-containing protein [Pseudomonadota bacterium]